MKISIVLPSYKNAEILRKELLPFISWLRGKPYEVEVIVVDDGSQDNGATEKVALENEVFFVGLPQNLGKGGAVRAGMKKATGDYRLFTDADIPFEYSAIDNFIYYLKEKEFHIA